MFYNDTPRIKRIRSDLFLFFSCCSSLYKISTKLLKEQIHGNMNHFLCAQNFPLKESFQFFDTKINNFGKR